MNNRPTFDTIQSGQDLLEAMPEVWAALQQKVQRMMKQLKGKTPHAADHQVYDDSQLDWWTSGFWPGTLWLLYDMTGDPQYREEAQDWDVRLEQCFLRESRFHHDVGFQFLLTAVMKHRLTDDQEARRRALHAANFLAGRFNLAGNFIRAQNEGKVGGSIIDSAMNLSLLFWASEEAEDPRYRHIALAHAQTILARFIREDGSVRHIVKFDPATGEVLEALGGQGYSPDSSWSRGQAWALYGLANVYRNTGDRVYLDAARKVANYFIAASQEETIPAWDFRVPDSANEPRDTSAAAIAASGLLNIASQLPEPEGRMYRFAALKLLAALTSGYAAWDEPEFEGILRGGTGNKPIMQNVDAALIYGDYYYVEALAKLQGWNRHLF
ncbi:glycosyl hydrolase [Paenibacillaceae bacterium]|nr:glycosyl hydrolase [Paenibacillaceae bacterium]